MVRISSSKRGRRSSAGSSRSPQRRFWPVLEVLERRTAPAIFTVNTTADTVAVNLITGQDASGNISLRSAIMAANNTGEDDTINLPGGTYALTRPGTLDTDVTIGDL